LVENLPDGSSTATTACPALAALQLTEEQVLLAAQAMVRKGWDHNRNLGVLRQCFSLLGRDCCSDDCCCPKSQSPPQLPHKGADVTIPVKNPLGDKQFGYTMRVLDDLRK
jgi:hypothetical protein